MDPKNKHAIDQMEVARNNLNAVLQRASPQDELYPTWKVKQVLDHIAGWDELVISALHAFTNGEPPVKMVNVRLKQFNAQSVATRKEMTLEQSRQAYDTARERLLDSLREIPSDMFDQKFPAPWGGTCTIDGIVQIFVSHELEHAKQIDEVIKE